ncbi:tRNA uracil 4-sulfurtransferase ThiI [Methanotorris formicicus]|uniref:Probable tRNA sulfurtransferase n=1 Tax=Methanotorris formicicus Mc-S-70 TaxID=647171 RepID=H1KWE0_9EURY|nr:tRNA uracil 4-sulfurtransferase ThiI [Methanotorris formicicus]EHP89517.1 thiamine biosynthesis/tRNA modification protein ThiI [Methanotorris formicicus Mc-S-70]
MEKIIVRYGEIGTKSKQTRKRFEEFLAKSIRKLLQKYDIHPDVSILHTRLLVEVNKEDFEKTLELLKKVPGISSFSPCIECKLDIGNIVKIAKKVVKDELKSIDKDEITFAVKTQRVQKYFPLTSPEINSIVGEKIMGAFGLKVDLKNPDILVEIEVLKDKAFVFTKRIEGIGGLPVGTQGNVLVLMSDGIDSSVATYLMVRRGCNATLLHLKLSEDGLKKVRNLAEILSDYDCDLRFVVKDFKDELKDIKEKLEKLNKEEYTCIFCKRTMLKIAEKYAKDLGCDAIVTGDNLGQVASQTLKNLRAISEGTELPILRPLIGMDKNEIIEIAKKIGTFEVSTSKEIRCFAVPKYPITKADIEKIREIERKLKNIK